MPPTARSPSPSIHLSARPSVRLFAVATLEPAGLQLKRPASARGMRAPRSCAQRPLCSPLRRSSCRSRLARVALDRAGQAGRASPPARSIAGLGANAAARVALASTVAQRGASERDGSFASAAGRESNWLERRELSSCRPLASPLVWPPARHSSAAARPASYHFCASPANNVVAGRARLLSRRPADCPPD